MIYAYIRVSTDQQSCSSQEYEINNWAKAMGITIDKWVKETISGTIEADKRKLGKTLKRMKQGDTLVCTEISRLGRSILMIMSILNRCASRGISIHTIKDNFDLSNNINSKIIAFAFALAAEIERNLISQRTKEALADKKAAGVVLGRPIGSNKCKKQVLADREKILAKVAEGVPKRLIAKSYGIHRNTLHKYLKEQ